MNPLNICVKIVAGLWILGSLASCQKQETAEKHEFYYFPKTNLYYDVAASQYIYSLDSTKTWNIVDAPTEEPPSILGRKEVVFSDNRKIWLENERHRSEFNGTIFNVSGGTMAYSTVGNEVSERRAPIKKPIAKKQVETAEQPKEKGLKKFINNIFGKKKDR